MIYPAGIQNEIDSTNSPSFIRGQYIYMGMGKLRERTVCISVAYKIDYCIKKAQQFAKDDPNIYFSHINKIKVGELVACGKFLIS